MSHQPLNKQENFRYCPKCASGRIRIMKNKMTCQDCEFEFFFNVATALAGLILDNQQRLLLVKRAQEPAQGMLDLPGGFANPRETAERALKREIKEELNLEVTAMQYFDSAPNTYPYQGFTYQTIDLFYLCQANDPHTAVESDDVASFCFIHSQDIDMKQIAFASTRRILTKFRKTQGV